MKFNTVKSKVLLFLSILTLLGTIFCIVSCDNFLSQNLGKTTININLDLSKLIKNSRNDDTQINGYVLKLFVYYAKNYQEGDKEIENLPLLTQTSNKVDINGTVKASLELSIASTVIFVGKLFTLNENNIESDKPLYAGKTDVYKVLPYNNNVHLVLSRDKSEIGFDIELQETHEHTFSREWSTSATHHWKVATCEHTEEVSKFGEHTFGEYVSNNDATTEADGTKTRVCSVCGYEDTMKDEGSKIHEHTFSREWSTSATHHWKVATCEHTSEVSEKAEHSYGEWITTKEATEETAGSKERVCIVCNYKETAEIAQLAHTHTFAIEWTYDGTYHWKVATCGHREEVSGKAEHAFGEYVSNNDATTEADGTKTRVCSVCGYEDTVKDEGSKIHVHTFSTEWFYDGAYHWKVATCEHSSEVSEKAEHSYGEWITTKEATEETAGSKERVCTVCNYKETAEIAQLAHTHTFAIEWTYDGTYHWKAATCGHSSEVSEKAEHTFADWTTINQPNIGVNGTKERYCQVCNYKETDVIAKIPENFVLIPADTFQMGSTSGDSDEKPVHEVTLTKDFYMGKYEVTQAEYEQYCTYGSDTTSEKPSDTYGDGDNYPAYYVIWYDALVYCNKRSINEGLTPCYRINEETDPTKWGTVPTSSEDKWDAATCNFEANGYRLPTEAEWEYAARAGDNTVDKLIYSGTNDENKLGEYAWYKDNSSDTTHEVGTTKANAFGLYDMSGNVWEWCWNWHTSSYDTTTEGESDPTGALSGSHRVCRGGGRGSDANYASVSGRISNYPYLRNSILGFRLVRASSK